MAAISETKFRFNFLESRLVYFDSNFSDMLLDGGR